MRNIEIKKGNTRILAVKLPYREKMCLCVKNGNEVVKFASFNSDRSATEFMNLLAELLDANEKN